MTIDDKNYVWYDMDKLPPGRIDRGRMGAPHPDDTEPRPAITAEDLEATRQLLAGRKRHMRNAEA